MPHNGGRNYYLLTTYRDWVERRQMLAAELPLGLYFRSNDPNCQFLFGFGGKLLLPVWNRYKVTDGSLETRGLLSRFECGLYNLPHHGFRLIIPITRVLSILGWVPHSLSIWVSASACRMPPPFISECISIMVWRMWVDGKNVKLRDAEGNYNGLLASDQVDYVSPFSLGVKIGLSLYTGKKPPHQLKKIALPAWFARWIRWRCPIRRRWQKCFLLSQRRSRRSILIRHCVRWWPWPKRCRVGQFQLYGYAALLNQADSAYQALTPAYKDSFPDTLSSKWRRSTTMSPKATLSNLHELLLHYNFYIFERDLAFCNLTSVEEEKLRQIADCVRMNPKVKLKVVGYACNARVRATVPRCWVMSARVTSVSLYLIAGGPRADFAG